MNIAIITGASAGMGREFVKQMDSIFSNIDEFWLIARRKERLEELSATIETKSRILPLDVTSEKDLEVLKLLLKQEKPTLRILVNCAGFGILGAFQERECEEQAMMVRLNCEALTRITHMCIPYMKKNSRIIQLASSAAFLPQTNFAVYAATKSYVLSFSRALGEELRKQQIYVTSVCPGPVETEFFTIAEKYGTGLKVKKLTLVRPEQVVHAALLASKRKQKISVYGGYIKSFRVLAKVLPHDLLLKIMRILK